MAKIIALILVLLTIWWGGATLSGSLLFPTPLATAEEFSRLFFVGDGFYQLAITIFRASFGVIVAFVVAILAGVPCGLSKKAIGFCSPFIAALQSCPSIVWVTLLMVWAGIGSLVPVTVVAISIFPVMFLNIAEGVASLDRRLFAMARLYQVPRRQIVKRIIFPGVAPYLIAGLSFTFGICWKVTSMAEFIGADSGVGAEIYWAYRELNVPGIFCWAFVLVCLGIMLDVVLVRWLRGKARGL